MNHLVYVIYFDGQPVVSRRRAAYMTEGTVKSEITRRVRAKIGWAYGQADALAREKALRERYKVVPYGRVAE